MLTREFWRATLERALKTLAQTALSAIPVTAVALHEVDWPMVGSIAGLATVASVLMSIGSAAVTDGSPSILDAESLPRRAAEG